MNNNYLIPANSKKSQMILGYFTIPDLIVLGLGCAITLTLIIIFGQNLSLGKGVLVLLPAIICGFLVTPVRYYHNVMQFLVNLFGRFIYYAYLCNRYVYVLALTCRRRFCGNTDAKTF